MPKLTNKWPKSIKEHENGIKMWSLLQKRNNFSMKKRKFEIL